MAKKQDAQKIYLHAQVPVIGFYEAMAFQCVGQVFEEAGIPHRKMVLTRRKRLERSRPSIASRLSRSLS
jgi:predicted GNAT family N-acyltransferase